MASESTRALFDDFHRALDRDGEARIDWVLVPRNPTREMLAAGATAPHDESAHLSGCQVAAVWYAMLDALSDAPTAKELAPDELAIVGEVADLLARRAVDITLRRFVAEVVAAHIIGGDA